MKKLERTVLATILNFLVFSTLLTIFLVDSVYAPQAGDNVVEEKIENYYRGQWRKTETDSITLLFPEDGKKLMFLWWYQNDTDNIYIMKFKGLIEYVMPATRCYLNGCIADTQTLEQQLEAIYIEPLEPRLHHHCIHEVLRVLNLMDIARETIRQYLYGVLELHSAFLSFSACQWNVTPSLRLTAADGIPYIQFDFTLTTAPPEFKFAENNIVVTCKFYEGEITENVHNLYNCLMRSGELKMNLIVKHWTWNIDKLEELHNALKPRWRGLKEEVPPLDINAGLALWIDLSSINIANLSVAEQDVDSAFDVIEDSSTATDIFVDGQRVPVLEDRTAVDKEVPVRNKEYVNERHRLQFAKGARKLHGFFDFINSAVILNNTGYATLTDMKASYISAGRKMRLFIGYPYFGNNMLEHDPIIGTESVALWLSSNFLVFLVAMTLVVAVVTIVVERGIRGLRVKPNF